MKEFLKKNYAIVLAFVLPIGLISIIALSTYLPSLFLSTDYSFIYSSCAGGNPYRRCDEYLQNRYSVVNSKLVVNEISPAQDSDNDGIPDVDENYTARLFLHDTEKNESREIAVAEAQTLNLSDLLTSPDGVTVSSHYDRGGGSFLFYSGRSSYGLYLTKGNIRKRLNLINQDHQSYYRNNFQFIGWVLPSTN